MLPTPFAIFIAIAAWRANGDTILRTSMLCCLFGATAAFTLPPLGGNCRGEVVMLSLAYGRQQRQEVKIHRPDLCYTAKGFKVGSLSSVAMPVATVGGAAAQGKRMKTVGDARGGGYTERVSYWMRIGSVYSESAWDTRFNVLTGGVAGRVPNGVLVRASRLVLEGADEAIVRPGLERFLADLVAAAPPDARRLLVH